MYCNRSLMPNRSLGPGLIVSRTVRDLDDGGRLLRVVPNEALGFVPKTSRSKRAVPVPQVLQPLLLARTRHKLPGALLLVAEGGGAHWRDWVSVSIHNPSDG